MPIKKELIEDDTRCAPTINYTDGSCFTLEQLIKIAKAYNDNKDNTEKIIISNTKSELVEQLKSRLSNICSTQTCWLKLDFIKELNDEDINEYTLRPIGPREKYDWLSTTNINDVVSQYHKKDPSLLFLGAVPYDFQELLILGIGNIDFNKLFEENKYKIGLVINLDEHYKTGSHWVALYTDLLQNQVYFFDSYGKKPRKRIKTFISKIVKFLYKKKYNDDIDLSYYLNKIHEADKKISIIEKKIIIIKKEIKEIKEIEKIKENEKNKKKSQELIGNANKELISLTKELDKTIEELTHINKKDKKKYTKELQDKLKDFDIRYNQVRHQFDNSECGVYSINFILRLVNGESFDSITNNITLDEEINKCRQVYFVNKI
jgi:hypothetical protein